MTVDVDSSAIREQLDRILGSELFAAAGRHSRLLRYVVERTLAGEGEQLKEYVLGTEVFDRASSYDPRTDSIVRVEARRLRSRLEDYYRGAGSKDPVLIAIPRGSYVPQFAHRDASATGHDSSSVGASPVRTRNWPMLTPTAIVAMLGGVVVAALAAAILLNGSRQPAGASSGPGIAVLPFEHFSTREQDALLVAQIADAVTTELAKLGTVSVASRTSSAQYMAGPGSVREIAKALNVSFVIEASVTFSGEDVRVLARLVDGRADRKVWVGEYELEPDIQNVARRIASDAAAAALRR
jgi:TolB-like protein